MVRRMAQAMVVTAWERLNLEACLPHGVVARPLRPAPEPAAPAH